MWEVILYSPKISEDLISRIHTLAVSRGISTIQVVDEILRRALLEDGKETATQEVHESVAASSYQSLNSRRDKKSNDFPIGVILFIYALCVLVTIGLFGLFFLFSSMK